MLPKITSSTSFFSTPARRIASAMTWLPRAMGETSLSAPPKLPIAVRAPLTMTADSMKPPCEQTQKPAG
jgi:hypothetical protein